MHQTATAKASRGISRDKSESCAANRISSA